MARNEHDRIPNPYEGGNGQNRGRRPDQRDRDDPANAREGELSEARKQLRYVQNVNLGAGLLCIISLFFANAYIGFAALAFSGFAFVQCKSAEKIEKELPDAYAKQRRACVLVMVASAFVVLIDMAIVALVVPYIEESLSYMTAFSDRFSQALSGSSSTWG